MNWKALVWLVIFPPVGIYLFFKGKKTVSKDAVTNDETSKSQKNITNVETTGTKDVDQDNPKSDSKSELKDTNDTPFYEKALRIVAKTAMLFAPLFIILNFFVTPENEQRAQDVTFAYLFLVIPFFLYPKHRKKIIVIALILGALVLMAESGVSSDDLESWWIKIPFLIVGTIIYFVVTGLLAAKSDDPELKALMADRSLKKEEIKSLVIAGGGVCIAIVIYMVWDNRDALLELFKVAGVFVGFLLIAIGNVFLGSKDGRFRTGFKGNFEPNYKIALSCFAIGIPWFLYGLMN